MDIVEHAQLSLAVQLALVPVHHRSVVIRVAIASANRWRSLSVTVPLLQDFACDSGLDPSAWAGLEALRISMPPKRRGDKRRGSCQGIAAGLGRFLGLTSLSLNFRRDADEDLNLGPAIASLQSLKHLDLSPRHICPDRGRSCYKDLYDAFECSPAEIQALEVRKRGRCLSNALQSFRFLQSKASCLAVRLDMILLISCASHARCAIYAHTGLEPCFRPLSMTVVCSEAYEIHLGIWSGFRCQTFISNSCLLEFACSSICVNAAAHSGVLCISAGVCVDAYRVAQLVCKCVWSEVVLMHLQLP